MLESVLSAYFIALGRFRCMRKPSRTQRTCRVFAEWDYVVHMSLPSSGGFVTRIPFVHTLLQDEICVIVIFLRTLVSFQRQPGDVNSEGSVVCSDIFPARVFRGTGAWVAPILHYRHNQGLCMEKSTDISRKSRSQQCLLEYQMPAEGKKW